MIKKESRHVLTGRAAEFLKGKDFCTTIHHNRQCPNCEKLQKAGCDGPSTPQCHVYGTLENGVNCQFYSKSEANMAFKCFSCESGNNRTFRDVPGCGTGCKLEIRLNEGTWPAHRTSFKAFKTAKPATTRATQKNSEV